MDPWARLQGIFDDGAAMMAGAFTREVERLLTTDQMDDKAAHRLAGSVGMMGDEDLARLLREVSHGGEGHDEAVRQVRELYDALKPHL